MDYWFLDNLDKLVPIIIAVLYFIGASRAKSKGDEQEGPSSDLSERARKIQAVSYTHLTLPTSDLV